MNFGDPFGLAAELLILGEDLAKEIAALRAANPSADSAFAALEASDELFVIEDGDATGCEICQYRTGQSFDLADKRVMSTLSGVRNYTRGHVPATRGWAYVNRDAATSGENTAAEVAWHEAGHLRGIPDRGTLNVHPTCPPGVQGIPGWKCQ